MASSRASSFLQVPSPSQIKTEHQIFLLDHTIPKTAALEDQPQEAEHDSSDTPTSPPEGRGLRRNLTSNSLTFQSMRREITKQKYARYGQDRYDLGDEPPLDAASPTTRPSVEQTPSRQMSYLDQAHARARAILQRKRTLGRGKDETDTVVDILYENQRGYFFFGIPKYSSNSLLPSDPRPWQNSQFRTSASDIRNAQVPDPSWEWAWKNWYVDMSRDVDEEGWEYSLAFVGKAGQTFAWHGNHPWFHSFVRRRRWLRMRRRRDLSVRKTLEQSHDLTAEYFTIHPRTMRPASLHANSASASTVAPALTKVEEPEIDVEKMEISNIGDLFLALRSAPLDREKLLAVRKFVDEGNSELYYLGERMSDIMGMMIFQSSRRQLLRDLKSRHERAHQDEEDLAQHNHGGDGKKTKQHKLAAGRADNLLRAVHAANELVQKLEYWSDIKVVSDSAVSRSEEGHERPSFRSKQSVTDGAPQLRDNTEGGSATPSKESSLWLDAQPKTPKGDDSGDEAEFVTPAQSTSELSTTYKGRKKSRSRARGLDGVVEEAFEGAEDPVLSPDEDTQRSTEELDIRIVEPVAEDEEG